MIKLIMPALLLLTARDLDPQTKLMMRGGESGRNNVTFKLGIHVYLLIS